jgi:hypothetical protein
MRNLAVHNQKAVNDSTSILCFLYIHITQWSDDSVKYYFHNPLMERKNFVRYVCLQLRMRSRKNRSVCSEFFYFITGISSSWFSVLAVMLMNGFSLLSQNSSEWILCLQLFAHIWCFAHHKATTNRWPLLGVRLRGTEARDPPLCWKEVQNGV